MKEEDPRAFLAVLKSLHDDLKKWDEKKRSNFTLNSRPCEIEWSRAVDGQRSIISDLFFVQSKTTTICDTCNNTCISYNILSSISLPLPDVLSSAPAANPECFAVDDLLDKYFSEQIILDRTCSPCGVSRNATNKTVLSKLGPIVVIQLERFTDDGVMNLPLLSYSSNKLDLARFLDSDADAITAAQLRRYNYRLYALCGNNGPTKNDSFFAECKSSTEPRWYRFDGLGAATALKRRSEGTSSTGYMLFYRSVLDDAKPDFIRDGSTGEVQRSMNNGTNKPENGD